MANPTTKRGKPVSLRVQTGSALERMTEGKSFTDAVHRMAELFERALNENWGPPAPDPEAVAFTAAVNTGVQDMLAVIDNSPSRPWFDLEKVQAQVEEITGIPDDLHPEPKPLSMGGYSEGHVEPTEHQRPVRGQQLYQIPSEDGLTMVVVNEAEAMRILKAQLPAGLEPVLDAYMIESENADLQQAEDFDYSELA